MKTLATLALRMCKAVVLHGGRAMEVILHIGMHRTGTTSFQALLRQNKAVLAARAMTVWGPDRTRNGLFTGLIHNPEELTPDMIRRGDRAAGLIRIEMERSARSGQTRLLVSEENIAGSIRSNLRSSRLYPQIDGRLERIAGAFAGRVTRVGMAIRSYDGLWSSALAYGLMHGMPLPDQDRLDRLVTQPRRWRDLVRSVHSAFSGAEVLVWPFERFGTRADAPLAILAGADMVQGFGEGQWMNPSPRGADLRRILVERGQGDRARDLVPDDGRWTPFDADHVAALRAEYSEDLVWLRNGADGIATFIETLPATTDRPTIQNNTMTELEVNAMQTVQRTKILPRVIGGHRYGEQGSLA